MSVPTREMACSSRFFGSVMPAASRWARMISSASRGVVTPHMRLKVYILKGRE